MPSTLAFAKRATSPSAGGLSTEAGACQLVSFGGLLMPRDEYLSPAPNDFSNFPKLPLGTAFPCIGAISDYPTAGTHARH